MNDKIKLWDRCIVGFLGWLTSIPLLNNSKNKVLVGNGKGIRDKEIPLHENQGNSSKGVVLMDGGNLIQ